LRIDCFKFDGKNFITSSIKVNSSEKAFEELNLLENLNRRQAVENSSIEKPYVVKFSDTEYRAINKNDDDLYTQACLQKAMKKISK